MTPALPSQDDQKRKEALQKFHEQSLKNMDELQKATQRGIPSGSRGTTRREDERLQEERSKKVITQEELALQKKKKQDRQWRAADKANKEEIEKDKKRRADQAKTLLDRRKTRQEKEDEQKKLFTEFRATAAAKGLKARKLYERDQQLKADVLRLDADRVQQRLKADTDELQEKNDIEHERLRKRDEINREFRDRERKLFDEEARQKLQLPSTGLEGRSRLDALMTSMQKKRTELQTEERQRLTQLDRDTWKAREDAETRTRNRKVEIDIAVSAKKAAIRKEREKLGL